MGESIPLKFSRDNEHGSFATELMLQLVREIPIYTTIQGALSSRRGFLFHLSAGFSHEVDPLSGMSVNLVKVDEWLWRLKKNLEKDVFVSETESLNHTFAEIMAVTRLNLLEETEKKKKKKASLCKACVFVKNEVGVFLGMKNCPPKK